MSLTKMMAWLNSVIGYSEKKPLPALRAGRGLLYEAWITSGYTASVRGGILPAPQEYQNPAGRQPGKTHRPTPMIVETTTISRTIPAQPCSLRVDAVLCCQRLDGILGLLEANPGLFAVEFDGLDFLLALHEGEDLAFEAVGIGTRFLRSRAAFLPLACQCRGHGPLNPCPAVLAAVDASRVIVIAESAFRHGLLPGFSPFVLFPFST